MRVLQVTWQTTTTTTIWSNRRHLWQSWRMLLMIPPWLRCSSDCHSLSKHTCCVIDSLFGCLYSALGSYPQSYHSNNEHSTMRWWIFSFLSHGSFVASAGQQYLMTQQISENINLAVCQCEHHAVIMQRPMSPEIRSHKDRYDFLKSVWNRLMDKKNGLHTQQNSTQSQHDIIYNCAYL